MLYKHKTVYLYIRNEQKFIKKYLIDSYNWKKHLLFRINKKKFLEEILGRTFDYTKCSKYNPYYLKYGFKFPMYEFEYYAINSGIKSDLYLPDEFFHRYILPYLNHSIWQSAYANKNMMARLLDINEAKNHIDVLVPECIACCDNGRFFIFKQAPENCMRHEAVEAVLSSEDDLIIKPTVQSAHGNGVRLLHNSDKTIDSIQKIFHQYGNNFVVQRKIVQHSELEKFNPSSVNTIRITTYQDFNGKVKILYATQRFGGKGKICDNADPHENPNEGGGFCAIKPDGTLDRRVHRMRNIQTTYLAEDIGEKIPYFDKVQKAACYLHSRFPHFALIAWDIAISPEGHPIVLEYNFGMGLATCQLAHGPLFSKEDLDEIMERVSKGKIVRKSIYPIFYPSKENYWI